MWHAILPFAYISKRFIHLYDSFPRKIIQHVSTNMLMLFWFFIKKSMVSGMYGYSIWHTFSLFLFWKERELSVYLYRYTKFFYTNFFNPLVNSPHLTWLLSTFIVIPNFTSYKTDYIRGQINRKTKCLATPNRNSSFTRPRKEISFG